MPQAAGTLDVDVCDPECPRHRSLIPPDAPREVHNFACYLSMRFALKEAHRKVEGAVPFLSHIFRNPPRVSARLQDLDVRAEEAVFWNRVTRIRVVSPSESVSVISRQGVGLHRRFLDADSLFSERTLSTRFMTLVEELTNDRFHDHLRKTDTLRAAFEQSFDPQIREPISRIYLCLVLFACAASTDPRLKTASRFDGLFDLWARGNPLFALDAEGCAFVLADR